MNWGVRFAVWPRDKDGRLVCALAHPMPTAEPQRHYAANADLHWVHVELDDDGPCIDGYSHVRCRACGVRLRVGAAEKINGPNR